MSAAYLDIQVCQDRGGYYGALYRNKPTPSGSDRYILWLTDNRRFTEPEEARSKFNALPTIKELKEKHER